MSERGVIAIDRGVFDHECFAQEPFTEREAWMWLIAEASWKARTRRVGRVVVDLKRGQLAASLRFLADKWRWPNKDKVDRFLARLRDCDMIATAAATGINVITIRNYDSYQKVSLPSATAAATENETPPRQTCDKTENIKSIETLERDGRAAAVEKLSGEFYRTIGVDAANPELSGFAGLPHHVSMWLERGYDRGLILATAADIHARAGPSKPLNYYAKAIENAHINGPPQPAGKHHGQPRQDGKSNTLAGVLAQLDDTANRYESSGVSEGGKTPPRLLSNR